MNRMERSRMLRRRRAYAAFSFLFCFVIFISGVYITDSVMKKNMLLDRESSLFSFSSEGQASIQKILDNAIDKISHFGKKAVSLLDEALDKLIAYISGMIDGLSLVLPCLQQNVAFYAVFH